jgi:hypothetical protein
VTGGEGRPLVRPAAQMRQPPPPPPGPPGGTVEERVAKWAAMLDQAVSLLNEVMTEVKEAGKDTTGHAE